MKNGNDNLKGKVMNSNPLESISGGGANETAVKYKINTEECIGCGACAYNGICPVGAVKDDNDVYKIDDSCIGCGYCADACPVEAIKPR